MKRFLAIPASALLFVSACGGGSDSSSTSSEAGGDSSTADQGSASDSTPTSSGETSTSSSGDGTISYTFSTSPDTLDPDAIVSSQAELYLMPVYDRLVQIDQVTAELKPMLATEWTVGTDDQGGYADFTLQTGLTFADGAAFGPDAVIANIERSQAAGGLTSRALASVTGAEVVSDNVVRIRTEGGAGWVPSVMGTTSGMMISPDAIDNDDLATVPAGIGMWTLERFDPAVVTYTATENYWDPEAQQADKLELHYIADDSARLNALRSGELDLTFLRPNQLNDVESAGLEIVRSTGATTYAFTFNTSRPGLDSDEVRDALQYAIDRTAIADQLLGGECTPNAQFFSPASPNYNPDVAVPEYDPERVKQALSDAGYADGFSFTMAAYDIDQYRRISEIVQAQFADVGIEVTLEVMPSGTTLEAFGIQQNVDATQTTPGLEADPSQLVATHLQPDSPMNPGGFPHEEIQSLAAEALNESDPETRSQLYQQISAAAFDDAAQLMICSPNFMYGLHESVQGFVGARAAGAPEWRGVSG